MSMRNTSALIREEGTEKRKEQRFSSSCEELSFAVMRGVYGMLTKEKNAPSMVDLPPLRD